MALALYHEEFGYYSVPATRQIGRKGDFFTSVSVGETFGFLLAHRIRGEAGARFDASEPVFVIEQGAHDGQLAIDILRGWDEISAQSGDQGCELRYRIIEPREKVRAALCERFTTEGFEDRIEVVASAGEAGAGQGVFLCNELLDAFPVEILTFRDGRWLEKVVTIDEAEDKLAWGTRELPDALKPFAEKLGNDFPEGYETEVCPAIDEWVPEVATLFSGKGLWWVIDYGYEAADYYAPSRRTGTLRCYRKHEATEDPFEAVGDTDITAHVNFSHLEEAAAAGGLALNQFTDQHHFLIHAAKPWLLSIEGEVPDRATAARLRQFQTLTHPSLMGQQFKVMELENEGMRE
ncbi:MAG: SAM-dependent methyltransferase [Verrucomicrobiales bacterium]|nr:SAM-dependent methyltransferase [Verrucomicrobiales bacterium]